VVSWVGLRNYSKHKLTANGQKEAITYKLDSMNKLHLSNPKLLQYKIDHIKSFEKMLQKASKHPTPKKIHKIRILIRRLDVVVSSRKLTKLAKVLGKERDLDVAINNAETYKLGTKKLIKKKKNASKVTLQEIKSFNTKWLKKKSDSQLVLKYKRMMRELNLELQDFKSLNLDYKKMHRLRIMIKQVRYGLEAIGQSHLNLQEFQDKLGQLQDLEVLQKLKGRKKSIKKRKDSIGKEVSKSYPSIIRFMRKNLNRI